MNGLIPKTQQFLKRNSASILTYVSLVGVVATAVLAVKATPKAIKILEDEQNARSENGNYDSSDWSITKKEIIQLTWQCYIPTAIMGTATIVCILGANILNKRNQASLISAYTLLNESFKKYRKAAISVYGEDADKNILAEVAKERWVHSSGYGLYDPSTDDSDKVLFYENFSNRYFTSTLSAVINAQYHINRNLVLRGYVTANEFYNFIGIGPIHCGDDFGWEINDMIEGGYEWLDFENCKTTLEGGMECYIISSMIEPTNILPFL